MSVPLRPAIVTGASSGIGREAARLLARSGFALLITGRRKDALEALASECPAGAWVLSGDIASLDFIEELIDAADDLEADGLPLLVNAAGIAAFGPTHEMDEDVVADIIEVNLTATILMCRAVIPWMLQKGGGDIVNVGSIASVTAFPQAGAYVASKAGLLAFSRSMSAEYRREGIRVTTILPGSTDTELWSHQSFRPDQRDMLPVSAVAEAIRDAVCAPRDRSFDEILLMPPKGILS